MTYPPRLAVPIEVFARRKTILDLPRERIAGMAVRLYMLGYIAWDYADTVVNIAAQQKRDETKKLCRTVRELKREYDRSRNASLRDADLQKERELAEMFEAICAPHMTRLCNAIDADNHIALLDPDGRMIVKSVYMAMAIIGAMQQYATEGDMWIRSQGVVGKSMLSKHFTALATLMPAFAGDAYIAHLSACSLTSSILCNEIKQLDIYHNDRKL